jgi:hypothetical protein
VISARFVHPEDALKECGNGNISLMPPQFYILSTLATILKGKESRPEERNKVEQLAYGPFGKMVINPRNASRRPDGEGYITLTYEGDETRGGTKGRLHRIRAKLGEKVCLWFLGIDSVL